MDYYNDNSGKQNIKVLVLVGEYPLAKKITHADGSVMYKGFYYDIWTKIKEQIKYKYNIQEFYSTSSDYDIITKEISSGKYDIAILPYTPTFERNKILSFTKSFMLDAPSILHFRKRNYFTTLFELIKDVFFMPLFIIITLGLIIGILLYYYDPSRSIYSGIKKTHHIRKSFLTIVTTFFGEYADLININKYHFSNISIIILIMTISLIINVYLQATATSKVIELNNEGVFNRKNINGKLFLSQTGYDDAEQMQYWGAKVEYVSDIRDNIVKKYLKNPDKYEGVILDRLENQYFLNKYKYDHPNLTISYSDFGFIDETFAVNKKDINFLNDVDSAIIKLQDTGGIEDVCKIYRDKDQVNLCIR
jgi:hypothetical protein